MKHFNLAASNGQFRFRRATIEGFGSLISIGPSVSRASRTSSGDALVGDARRVGEDLKVVIGRKRSRAKEDLAG
ncbi:hypothetical protein [Planktotalea sp.]|uniref:hypothetical protein n=1 Tax=Planktotalea sp. TaxID=2029877 RepID=UPI0025EEB6CA|nr:hypothetical protein [Planktotalea sp.]